MRRRAARLITRGSDGVRPRSNPPDGSAPVRSTCTVHLARPARRSSAAATTPLLPASDRSGRSGRRAPGARCRSERPRRPAGGDRSRCRASVACNDYAPNCNKLSIRTSCKPLEGGRAIEPAATIAIVRTAVITGGSSGIGLAVARLLERRGGWQIVLAARREEPLAHAAAGSAQSPCAATSRSPPMSRHWWPRPPGGAGATCSCTPPARLRVCRCSRPELADYRAAMEVNYIGLVRVATTFWPLLEAARGRFVPVVSIAGAVALAPATPYGASKAAALSWARSYGAAARTRGVAVTIVNPGPVTTAGFPQTALVRSRLGRLIVIDAERCAERMLAAADRRTPEVYVPQWWRLVAAVQGAVPGVTARVAARAWRHGAYPAPEARSRRHEQAGRGRHRRQLRHRPRHRAPAGRARLRGRAQRPRPGSARSARRRARRERGGRGRRDRGRPSRHRRRGAAPRTARLARQQRRHRRRHGRPRCRRRARRPRARDQLLLARRAHARALAAARGGFCGARDRGVVLARHVLLGRLDHLRGVEGGADRLGPRAAGRRPARAWR